MAARPSEIPVSAHATHTLDEIFQLSVVLSGRNGNDSRVGLGTCIKLRTLTPKPCPSVWTLHLALPIVQRLESLLKRHFEQEARLAEVWSSGRRVNALQKPSR